MNKKHSIYLITIAVIVSVIFQLFLTPTLLARLSVSSWLSKFKILNPQAPIVINTVKEVRVSDTGDVQQALGKLKPGISAIFMADSNGVKMTGGAINISSDGIFVSSKLALPANASAKYYVVLSDGTTKELNKEVLDPVTNLVFLKADLSNVPVANLVNSQDLEVGQKVIFVQGSGVTFTPRAEVSYVTVSQQDNLNQIFSADKPSREFGVQGLNNLLPGMAIATTDGSVAGIWDGNAIISSDVLKATQTIYFGQGGKVTRPSFGFNYQNTSPVEKNISGVTEGAKVVSPLYAPALGQLRVGDIITQVNDIQVSSNNTLEELLEKISPGDSVKFTVNRSGQEQTINIATGILK